jgi:type II secretory ATPase GspE/PulE/Tfp pilus assembly ATPase PilB-like protein
VLDDISGEHSNILTVEDPVERVMPKITQVKVTSKISFAAALRSFLRHDPDVIMVGEIRDGETAGIALKAAMTGHLVLSTVHTNTAAGAVARMVDLGTEPYLIGATSMPSLSSAGAFVVRASGLFRFNQQP